MVGIPPLTPHNLATMSPRLPTILYILYQNPIPSYSKAPWGLSVLLQVTGIFTGITISPGLPSRQLSELSLLLLTFRHWAGVSPYTSPYSLA